jgi:O-antigen/teichoic acid export membrane protein
MSKNVRRFRSALIGLLASFGADQRYILVGGAGTLFARIVGMALVMAITAAVTRGLGAGDYGKFSFFLSIAFIAVLLGNLGLPVAASRLIVRYRQRRFFHREAHFVLFSLLVMVAFSTTAMLILVYGVGLLPSLRSLLPFAVWGMVAYVVGTTMARFLVDACRAMSRPISTAIAENIVGRIAIMLGLAALYATGSVLNLQHTLGLWIVGTYATVGLLLVLVLRELNLAAWPRIPRPFRHYRGWLAMGSAMMVTPLFYYVLSETDILILGVFSSPEQVGIYNVARRLAELMQFAYGSVGAVLLPRIADAYGHRDNARMQTIIDSMNVLSIAPGLLLVLVLVAFGRSLLSMFGEPFVAGYGVLLLLCLPRLIDMALGPVSEILMMCGQHKKVSRLNVVFGVANILLNVALIPALGAIGAALATATTVIAWKCVLYRICLRTTQVQPCLAVRLFVGLTDGSIRQWINQRVSSRQVFANVTKAN